MSARVLDCPQCGAPVNFQSAIAVFAVCAQCGSMVVLRGAEVELMGVMAALPPDLSPFQIGTRGEWKGRGFEIVGRIRVEWEEGSWNEWCILYDAKTTGWLAEAQGLLTISFATEVKEQLPADQSFFAANLKVTINDSVWVVEGVKTVTCRAAEGELPFVMPPQTKRVGVDLFDAKGGFASVELSEDDPEVYLGEYATFETLKLTNLRPVPGWSGDVAQEKNRTTPLACPSCGAVVGLRAAGQSMSAVCGSCGAVLDTATPELQIIQKADEAVRKLAPLLPIGQRGKILGLDCEIVGMVARRDKYSKWSEYLLFNPWQGFRWLVFFDGHWTLVDRLTAAPEEYGKSVESAGRQYRLFAEGEATITGVLGEFYWKTQRGESAKVADYIAPPFIISKETYPQLSEVTWSRGQYLEPAAVAEAFAVADLPPADDIYLIQPNKFARRWVEVRKLFFVTLAALFLIQCSSLFISPETKAVEASFVFDRAQLNARTTKNPSSLAPTPPAETRNFVTPHFNLEAADQRVTVEATAPVDNSWLDLDLDLVNAKTNASFSTAVQVSYYHGYDSDGSWTEGRQNASATFAGVPRGEYFLVLEPTGDEKAPEIPCTVRVLSGGVFFGNFIVVLGLVLFYPMMLLWRGFRFEKARWDESDFSSD